MTKLVLVIAACALSACSSPQAKMAETTVANTLLQVGVDVCQETGESSGPLIAVLCSTLDANQSTVKVLIDNAIWTSMKRSYLAQKGFLPRGMTLPDGGQ